MSTPQGSDYQYTAEKISILMTRFSPSQKANIVFSAISMDQKKFFKALETTILAFTVEEINTHKKANNEKISIVMKSEDFDQDIQAMTMREMKEFEISKTQTKEKDKK